MNNIPEVVQFDDGTYAIRRKSAYGRYEFVWLDDKLDFWCSNSSTGRKYYATKDKTKVDQCFINLIAKEKAAHIAKEKEEQSRRDFGKLVSDSEAPESRIKSTPESQVYIGRTVKKFKLPKFGKWFTD